MQYALIIALSLIAGYRLARAKNNRIMKKRAIRHIKQMHANHTIDFEAGWNSALASPTAVKIAHNKIFNQADNLIKF